MVRLVVESWIWWSVAFIVAVSRFISRWMTLGSLRRFQPDDITMLVILCFYTTLIVTINIVRFSSSNLLEPGADVDKFTPKDIHDRVYGSKLILVVEQCQIVTVWGAKACLLILYNRLTTLRRENIGIKILGGYVAFGFVFMEIFYFGVWCRPFPNYWAVPTPNVQCNAATNHLITNAVFNLSSDVAMLIIGLPMFLRMNLPIKKKIPLVGIFSLGIFVLLAAILNKVYSFSQPFGASWTFWYVRESSTAVLVANLPFVWTVWRKITGMKETVHGTTTQGTELGRSRTLGGTRRDVLSPADSSRDSLEMEEGYGRRMTLQDMLSETNPAADRKDVTPYTHPQLFFSMEAAKARKSSAPFALTDDLDSDTNSATNETRATDAPTISTCPMNRRSTESMV